MISVHKVYALRSPHCPSSPQGSEAHTREAAEGDPTHEPEDFWAAADAIPQRKGLIQELFTGRKSLLKSRREAFKKSSGSSLLCSHHSGESKRLTDPSCYTCQDIQMIILRLFFLQKTRPFPDYWLAMGTGVFITWVTVSETLQETGKCQKLFKGRLCETLGFHKTHLPARNILPCRQFPGSSWILLHMGYQPHTRCILNRREYCTWIWAQQEQAKIKFSSPPVAVLTLYGYHCKSE